MSVFGRGFGESICVHLGDGEWIVVDSCFHPETSEPAALAYLRELGVPSASAVSLIVISHWDDDHIRGISEIVEHCAASNVVCSAALCREEIFQFVVAQERTAGATGSGVDELRSVLRLCRGTDRRIIWAKANLALHPQPPGDHASVVAVSPSEDAVERSVEALIEAATQQEIATPRRYKAPEGPNGASVATVVRGCGNNVLLGADLERSDNTESGWDAVVRYAKPELRSSLFKVAHHGSGGADHPDIWAELVEEEVVAILTPWSKGTQFLPTQEDLDRLRTDAHSVFLTAVPSLARVRKDPDVERLVRRLHGEQINRLKGWGHVRARRRLNDDSWTVELRADAVAV